MTMPMNTRTRPASAAAAPRAPRTTSFESIMRFGGAQSWSDAGAVVKPTSTGGAIRGRPAPGPPGEGLIGRFPHLVKTPGYSKGLQRLAKATEQLSIGFTVAGGVEMTTRATKVAKAVAFDGRG